MYKRLLAFAALVLLGALAVPGVASAHVLKVDGHIGAVLHINPDDNATTGHPTDYELAFSDDTGRFQLAQCNCRFSIIENNRPVATLPLAYSATNVSENRYTFTTPAVYTLRFTGTPYAPGAFQPFTLNYEVRVSDGQAAMQPMPLLLWIGMGMAVGLILLGSYVANNTDSKTGDTA